MLHQINRDASPALRSMASAIEGCVHCGFCLPACPTYGELGEEMDSPRGRIILMKEVLEGQLSADAARPYIDRCLGCLACEPACPSGVPYGELLHPYRSADRARLGPGRRLWTGALHRVLSRPGLFRWALRLARPAGWLAGLLPGPLAAPLGIARAVELPSERKLPRHVESVGERRGRVGLLTGCAQEVLRPQINDAALRVLARAGFEVEVPAGQGCCGSLAMHDGLGVLAAELASTNVRLFPPDYDWIVTTSAGCGSGMKEYPQILEQQGRDSRAASEFSARVIDIASLIESTPLEFPRQPSSIRVAYQGACHLENAQGLTAEPRRLLGRIPEVELIEVGQGECCGSAGTYNLEQPEIADQLGAAKAAAVIASGAQSVVTGNIGCLIQMQIHLHRLGRSDIEVMHTIELVDRCLLAASG